MENKKLLETYRNKIDKIEFLKAVMELSDTEASMKKIVDTMRNIHLPSDFWDEFKAEAGTTDVDQNHELLEKLTQFQHYADHKRTSKLVQSYTFENPMISLNVHDQGADSFTCWAYSSATMIGSSCRVLVTNIWRRGLIGDEMYDKCMEHINEKDFHTRTRNAIMMILVPRHLHVDDESQAAFLRAAVSRLVNETILDREGVFYLEKVTQLMNSYSTLNLSGFPISVTYKTYYNNYHPNYQTDQEPTIDDAVRLNLCPVASVDVASMTDGPAGHGIHALVLDTMKDGNFIFKNTYVKNKRVIIPAEQGPLEFFFVHMEVTLKGVEDLKKKHWVKPETLGSTIQILKQLRSKSNFVNK